MRLNPRTFNAHLRHMGQQVSWRRAAPCPCRDPHTGGARQGCPHCAGVGWLWAAAQAGVVGVTSMRVAREWDKFGSYESGDVVVSIGSDTPVYAAGEKDRVTFVQSSEPFAHQAVHTGVEKLAFVPVSIERAFWLTAGAKSGILGLGEIGAMELGSDVGDELVEGSVLSVAADGTITWATAPPVGVQYSITGRRRIEYFLFKELPQDRAHHGGLALPRRVALRRYDLFGR